MTSNLPFVSIVMPVRNEKDFIRRSLGALLEQDYPAGCMEILVSDGGSADGTGEILKGLSGQDGRIRVYENPDRIVSAGLNRLLRHARGEIIVRIDAHTIVEKDYVRCCVEALQRSGADNAGGRMNAKGTTLTAEAAALATSCVFGVGNAHFHYAEDERWVDTVYMGAWKRGVFERIGLFDEELVRNQDDEFNYRLRANGGKILLSPSIRSIYYARATVGGLWSQYFQYGFWKVRVLQKHPAQMQVRQFVPAVFCAVLAAALAAAFSGVYWPLAAVMLPYASAALFFSMTLAGKHGMKYLPFLPGIFAVLHLAYGTGFIAGLFRFWNRWRDADGGAPGLEPSGVNPS